MEILTEKINSIKKNYFTNIFNPVFIDDAYIFYSNLPDEYFDMYSNDPIFVMIQELYTYNHANSLNNSKQSSNLVKNPQTNPQIKEKQCYPII